jgi:hypothetical protein
MATESQPKLSLVGGLAALVLLLVQGSGCATLDLLGTREEPPTGVVHQLTVQWVNQVIFTPDPVHGGAPTPGLAGRLWLYGPEIGIPFAGDGSLVVDLFEEAPGGPDGKPIQRERWNIDKDTLRRLLKKDMIGWGYTLFLPWSTYRSEVTQVRLRVCYQPANGPPIYAPERSTSLTSPEVANTVVGQRENTDGLKQTSAKVPAPAPAPSRPAAVVPGAGPR